MRTVPVTALLATVGLLAGALLSGCPTVEDNSERPDVEFDPAVAEFGHHALAVSSPAPVEVRLVNRGQQRFFVDELRPADGWIAAGLTTSTLPAPVEPGGWVTLRVSFVGEPEPGRTDWDSMVTAVVSPAGTANFDAVVEAVLQVRLSMDCDADDDGYAATECGGSDCDDLDATHSPNTEELCNGLDDDCNGLPDADEAGVHGERDADDDGFLSCRDCDDGDPDVNPDATERCDGVDTDCNPATHFANGEGDFDADGSLACEDCDDMDHDNAPGNVEHCDGADNDCDGELSPLEVDNDGDEYTECNGDCDDTRADIAPFAPDAVGDGVDMDCDGEDG